MKLSKGRKQRQPAPELASVDDMAAFQLLASQPLHKTGKVRPLCPARTTHCQCVSRTFVLNVVYPVS